MTAADGTRLDPRLTALFDAGASWATAGSTRPWHDDAVREAVERATTLSDDCGWELAGDVEVVERALRHADLSTREVEATRAVLRAAQVDSPTVRANYGPGEERLRADLRRYGAAVCAYAAAHEVEPREVSTDDAAELFGILAVAQWMDGENLARALGLDVDAIVADGDIETANAERIGELRALVTPPAPEGEAGRGVARRGLGDPYPIAQAIDGVTADLDASLSPRADLVRVLLDVANTYVDRLIVEARTWTAPGCRCRDPLREVNALCPSHGHSPELADPPAPAGPQAEGAGEPAPDWTNDGVDGWYVADMDVELDLTSRIGGPEVRLADRSWGLDQVRNLREVLDTVIRRVEGADREQ